MKAQRVTYGPWQIVVAVKHVLCADGRRRRARVTSEPDTYFSQPASICVKGKTVSGYITGGNDGDLEFRAVQTGKNYNVLPNKPFELPTYPELVERVPEPVFTQEEIDQIERIMSRPDVKEAILNIDWDF